MRSWLARHKTSRLLRVPPRSDDVTDHRLLAEDGLPLQDENGIELEDEDADG
jgi:hypothetical protein